MILRINGIDITSDVDVQIINAIFTQYANSLNDTLQLSVADTEGLWSSWINDKINTIQIIQDEFDTGTLYPHKIVFENNKFNIIARSMPPSRISKRSKKWKEVTFDEIGSEVASNLNLRYSSFGIDGSIFYELIKQKAQSDLSFFSFLCMLEGYGMLIFNEQLVVYDIKKMESESLDNVSLSEAGVYRFTMNETCKFGSCTVSYSKDDGEDESGYTGTFSNGDGYGDLVVEDLEVTSDAQALRWAKGLLREANKNYLSGYYSKPFHSTHSPGTAITLKAEKSVQIDGPFFIEKIEYDFKNNKTVTHIRGCLSF